MSSLLRFIACGSVDDGKSTLVGRLLFEAGALSDDHLAALEREQGTTIDVAYRHFSTPARSFIVADAPGHEQYTRNMVTGASTADVAVILVDARNGIVTQTRRHSHLVSLLGIRHVVLAVNKLDLVGWSQETFRAIEREYVEFAGRIGIEGVTCIPLSALRGDNVATRSERTPWHSGPTLREFLETVDASSRAAEGPFRMPVQWVNRPDLDFRGYSGPIVGGTVRRGDRVRVLPAGIETSVARIVARGGDLDEAAAGQSVTLVLADPVDVARGDLLAAARAPALVADQFEATVVWMGESEMLPGRPYLMKAGARSVGLRLGVPKYKLNVNTLERLAARTLRLNDIGVCNLSLDASIAFDPYSENRDTGGFLVIDRVTNATVGAGMLHFALRRAQNIHWQSLEVGRDAHAALKGQRPCVVWFTGFSAAGKSTIANLVEKQLHAAGVHTYLLDGDNVRHGLNRDLGFTDADRVENIRRVAEVARLMSDAGLVVLVAFISPFRAERRFARELVPAGEFCEVFVDVPLAVAEGRDTKGLYRKARAGLLANFTGVDSPYEPPEDPEIRIDAAVTSAEEAAEAIVARLREMRILTPSSGR